MKDVSKGHVAILIVNIIFGLNIPIAKEVLSNGIIDPLALTYFRVVGAALVFWFASIFIKSEKLTKKDFLILFLGSIFAISLNQTSFIVGLQTTTPIDASLIITLTPIITMLISAAYLKEPITTKKSIGVLVGLSGALILILILISASLCLSLLHWALVLKLIISRFNFIKQIPITLTYLFG